MEVSERIQKILDYSGLNISQFSRTAGFVTPQAVREMLNGRTKSISKSAESKILKAFPQLNIDWLKTGEGEMLRSNYTQTIHGGEKIVQHGTINETASTDILAVISSHNDKVLRAIEAQTEAARTQCEATRTQAEAASKAIDELSRQNDRLLSLIEKLTDRINN